VRLWEIKTYVDANRQWGDYILVSLSVVCDSWLNPILDDKKVREENKFLWLVWIFCVDNLLSY